MENEYKTHFEISSGLGKLVRKLHLYTNNYFPTQIFEYGPTNKMHYDYVLNRALRASRHEYSTFKYYNIYTTSWNINDQLPPSSFRIWLFELLKYDQL